MIKSYLELNIFEVSLDVGISLLIPDWLVSCKASTRVNPAVCVFFCVLGELYEKADLRHDVISIANLGGSNVYTIRANGIIFSLFLVPNQEVETSLGIVWLPS